MAGLLENRANDRPILLNIRTSPKIREGLKELATLYGEKIGFGSRLSQSQTIELLISKALQEEKSGNAKDISSLLQETSD